MDYIYLSACLGLCVSLLVTSYDIACQWGTNFRQRMESFPQFLQLNFLFVVLKYLIPKFHLPGHGLACQSLFSFNLTRGVGRTDGEGIERLWSTTNGCAGSTKEMGPGARHDTLDDHFGDWNWRLLVGMGKELFPFIPFFVDLLPKGTSFTRKLQEAIPERNKHKEVFSKLSSSLSSKVVQEWSKMLQDWEADNSKPNPYEVMASSE